MDKQQAQNIIRETFENSFDKTVYTGFIKNLLNRIEDSAFTYQGNYIPDAYKQYIKTLERIGKFSDGEHTIDILVIKLQKETSLERARTMQRNFIAWYLNGSRGGEMKDAALAAFVSPDETDWRFSLVKMDYKFEQSKSGKTKVKEEFTPARRWSFLVGKNEKSHTAQTRLVTILKDDEHDPTLEDIEKAFDIETVTKEFFLEYRGLFLHTKDELDKVVTQASSLRDEFEAKGVDTVNFAKKLLGQIVFLYFLQKKGWFGVGRDDDWGTGSKHFLRELFEKEVTQASSLSNESNERKENRKQDACDTKNFFNDILEPLFYDALSRDRSDIDHWNDHFKCKIPFLNGGLFDPIGNYSWYNTDILLPNELFSNNVKTKNGDEGTGILDVFDRYNFTVKEDEPLEKEVAIDPELLGKAYEKFNAIRPDNYDEFKKALKSGKKGEENKFNKKFGVYYTPREIVHYMCRQGLINYLFTECNTSSPLMGEGKGEGVILNEVKNLIPSKEDIEALIHLGEQVSENEATALLKERLIAEGKQKTTKNKLVLPESIKNNAALIDKKLAEITVCDPAVGSGAFPVGMMSEIVKARNVLSLFVTQASSLSTINTKHKQDARDTYNFKRHCIERSLYGVDIDPGAVEIAKLRLWLSLVVDENDINNIKPLPNLDYKVACGNSLLGVEKNLFNLNSFNELEKLKPLFFNETNPTKKQEYRVKIDDLISKITNGRKEFDFKIYFSEVFHHKGGFDVVIGNPPYVQLQKDGGRLANMFKNCGYKTFERTGDIYSLFYEKGITLLKNDAVLTFITSNKWMRAGYGKSLRKFFNSYNPHLLVDLGPGIFESATVDTNILIIEKKKNQGQLAGLTLNAGARDAGLSDFISNHKNILPKMGDDAWFIGNQAEQNLKEKIERIGKPLKEWDVNIYFGIKTGLNEAFIIDTATCDRLVAEDPKSAEILKPILRGRDIKRYGYEWAGLCLIFIPWHFPLHNDLSIQGSSQKAEIEFKKQYRSIYNHLLQFKDSLSKRNKAETGIRYEWYALQRCAATYYPEFEKEKVVWKRIGSVLRFGFDTDFMYCQDSTCIMTGNKLKYLCAFMNSRLGYQMLYDKAPKTGTGDVIVSVQALEPLLIPPITPSNKGIVEKIERIVEKILYAKKQNPTADTSQPEREIDRMVYQLYDLTPEEIKIVEGEG